jgi:DNA-binding MurR/RpiR family transcriptional regulator
MDPEKMTDLMDPIVDGRADYTKGNRFLGRTERGDMPLFRFVGNATLGAITKIASGYWNSGDPQSGYTVISKRALERSNIEEMYEFYGYCNDLLVKLNVAGMRVVDVPRPIIYGDEESHIKYHTYIPKVSGMLAKNFLWRLKTKYLVFDFHPLVAAYGVGAISSLVGLLGFLWALPGVGSFGTPLARGGAAAGFLLFGVLSFVLAMGMDMEANEGLSATLQPEFEDDAVGEPEVAAGEPVAAGEAAGEVADPTVTVELGAREWASVADAEVTDGGTPSDHELAVAEVLRALERLPSDVQQILDQSSVESLAARNRDRDGHFFIGRGVAYPVALEGALKFKEITYEHAEGFAAGELKHGPLALVTPDTPVFAVFSGLHDEKTLNNVEEVQTRGAPVVGIGSEASTEVAETVDEFIPIPDTHPLVSGVLANVQLQLVAYHVADLLGRSIDKPRNLAKSVTVE